MESASVQRGRDSGQLLESTLELPRLQSEARERVDIYLPRPLSQWHGPALQQRAANALNPTADPDLDAGLDPPISGIVREVDTSFSSSEKRLQPSPSKIRNFGRRSGRRGLALTVAFLLLVAAVGFAAYLKADVLLAMVFAGLPL